VLTVRCVGGRRGRNHEQYEPEQLNRAGQPQNVGRDVGAGAEFHKTAAWQGAEMRRSSRILLHKVASDRSAVECKM
jgi:hypothetical protein